MNSEEAPGRRVAQLPNENVFQLLKAGPLVEEGSRLPCLPVQYKIIQYDTKQEVTRLKLSEQVGTE